MKPDSGVEVTVSHSARERLKTEVRALALALQPDAKLPTRAQLCSGLGASKATMDTVLSDLEALNVIYRRQGSGIYVSPRLFHKQIAIVAGARLFEQIDQTPYWSILWAQLLKSLTPRAIARAFDIRVQVTMPPELSPTPFPAEFLRHLEEGRIDGILGISLEEALVDLFLKHHVPLITHASEIGDASNVSSVDIDIFQIVKAGTSALLRRGCRRIALLDARYANDVVLMSGQTEPETVQAYRQALMAQAVAFDPALSVYGSFPHSETSLRTKYELGRRLIAELFDRPEPDRPDGLVCGDDAITYGALAEMEQRGLRVGLEIPFASHSNIGSPLLLGRENQMILVQVSLVEVAETMVATLEAHLDAPENPLPETITIPIHVAQG